MTDTDIADGAPILRHLDDWYARQHQHLREAGTATAIKHSPPEWPKASIALEFDADPRLATLITWDTGETELDLVDLHNDTHTPQHYDITTTVEMDRLLDGILIWLSHGSHSQPST